MIYSNDEWELRDISRQLAYEETRFDRPDTGAEARARHAGLLLRQQELKQRIRRDNVMDRFVMHRLLLRERIWQDKLLKQSQSPFTPMLMDEVIQDGRLVDLGD